MMKYVIVEQMGLEVPVVFSELMRHDLMAKLGKPVSAGFCAVDSDGFSCWGKSITLKLESRTEDSNLLNEFLLGRNNG